MVGVLEERIVMPGTKTGGLKARDKNLASDPDFYKRIGARGGANGRGPKYRGGFAHPNADPRTAGARGGRISRRNKAAKVEA